MGTCFRFEIPDETTKTSSHEGGVLPTPYPLLTAKGRSVVRSAGMLRAPLTPSKSLGVRDQTASGIGGDRGLLPSDPLCGVAMEVRLRQNCDFVRSVIRSDLNNNAECPRWSRPLITRCAIRHSGN